MADIEIKRIPRIDVKKAGTLVGTRPAINLIEGSNITLTVADDSAGNEVDVTIAASGGSAVPSDFQPAIVTGNYYTQLGFGVVNFGSANPSDQLVAYPIWFSHTETWTRILINVAVGSGNAADKVRLGIWANGTGNVPGALLVDSGELSLETAGEVAATISQQLTANTLYWIGSLATNANMAQFDQGISSAYLNGLCGVSSAAESIGATDSSSVTGYYIDMTYAALPDPFGTPDGTIGTLNAIWLRKV